MKLINYTPHTINIHVSGEILSIEPSGWVAKIHMQDIFEGTLYIDSNIKIPLISYEMVGTSLINRDDFIALSNGTIRLVDCRTKEYIDPLHDEVHITSPMFASKYLCSGIVSPTKFIRDDNGQVIGWEALMSYG